jgi:hypothetical protein
MQNSRQDSPHDFMHQVREQLHVYSWRNLFDKTVKIELNIYHLLFFVCSVIALQFAFFMGASLQRDFNIERAMLAVENRVSLDLAYLSLPNPRLNVVGDQQQIHSYLQQLNAEIKRQNMPVQVLSLQGIDAPSSLAVNEDILRQHILRRIETIDQVVHLKLAHTETSVFAILSFYPLLLAALLVFLSSPYLTRKPLAVVKTPLAPSVAPIALVLDFEHKYIGIHHSPQQVFLANKPLCFYAALLNYCQLHPEVRLCQHSLLPKELLDLADKYFLRLVELGHTIRKRPDFNANLEKMLSEIRAALDELLMDHPDSKTIFYPPKALGEGSRSKQHSFSLTQLSDAHWEIKGK